MNFSFISVRVHEKTDAEGKKFESNFKSVRTPQMIEEERNRLREESLEEFINEFNEDPYEKHLKEQWWKIRSEYHKHLHHESEDGQSPHLEECKKLFMNILEESLKRYENDPLNTDKGQIISKNVMAISKFV